MPVVRWVPVYAKDLHIGDNILYCGFLYQVTGFQLHEFTQIVRMSTIGMSYGAEPYRTIEAHGRDRIPRICPRIFTEREDDRFHYEEYE